MDSFFDINQVAQQDSKFWNVSRALRMFLITAFIALATGFGRPDRFQVRAGICCP